MNTAKIIQELKAERDRLHQAIAAIEAIGDHRPKRGLAKTKAAAPKERTRRHLSPAARTKLARVMKQRWAARKKAGKSTLG